MARIALIDTADQIVRIEREERIDQTAGVRTGYRWLPVEHVFVDNSTGPDWVDERAAPVVEALRVSITTTRRDMTAQEIADRAESETGGLIDGRTFKEFVEVIIDEINILRTDPRTTLPPRTFTQFRAAMKNRLGG